MEGRRTYFLDLQTLLTQLRRQTCTLTTKTVVERKAATGYVLLKEGALVNCFVRTEDGAEIAGKRALALLEQCTEWQVQLEQPGERSVIPPTEMSPQSMPSVQVPPQQPFPPAPFYGNSGNSFNSFNNQRLPLKQKRRLDPSLLQRLPVKQRLVVRMIFTMINGERSLEEIKARLQLPSNVVDEIVGWLRTLDLIE